MRREAALIFSPNGGSAEKAPPSTDGSAPQARPSFSLRPKAAFFTPPKRGASQPPILFSREKRTGRWSGPRENAPGASILTVLHEARKGPWTPPDWVRARRFTQPTLSKKKGLTGEHGSPVKSRAARGAVPHCISAEMPRLWGLGALPLGEETSAPSGRKIECGRALRESPVRPVAASSRPRPRRKSPFSGKRNRGRQSLRRLRRQLPLRKGAIFGAASPQGGNPAVRGMFKRLERFLRGAPSGRKEQARPAGKEALCNTLM